MLLALRGADGFFTSQRQNKTQWLETEVRQIQARNKEQSFNRERRVTNDWSKPPAAVGNLLSLERFSLALGVCQRDALYLHCSLWAGGRNRWLESLPGVMQDIG